VCLSFFIIGGFNGDLIRCWKFLNPDKQASNKQYDLKEFEDGK